jgi:hypothetical protein
LFFYFIFYISELYCLLYMYIYVCVYYHTLTAWLAAKRMWEEKFLKWNLFSVPFVKTKSFK